LIQSIIYVIFLLSALYCTCTISELPTILHKVLHSSVILEQYLWFLDPHMILDRSLDTRATHSPIWYLDNPLNIKSHPVDPRTNHIIPRQPTWYPNFPLDPLTTKMLTGLLTPRTTHLDPRNTLISPTRSCTGPPLIPVPLLEPESKNLKI